MDDQQQLKSLRIDTWMMEMAEASNLIELLELKLQNFNNKKLCPEEAEAEAEAEALFVGILTSIEFAQSKVFQLWVMLDRLDSLLRNPPSQPILADGDVKFRWSMLLDIRQRTRVVAQSLSALAATYRTRTYSVSVHEENPQPISKDRHTSCRENEELLTPLVSDWADESEIQSKQSCSSVVKTCLLKLCWAVIYCLGAAAVLYLMVVIAAALPN